MPPPKAADNFGQRQPITTAIKTICLYYPPNTCLRELLQNADDAGATEIEYVLDTKTYDNEQLLHEELRDYQGPALLARNNSVFRDQDFESLSSVGDSVKKQDLAATGKFGQGFNAVYHWTDGPWIYSRNWLLILDPHEWWSRDVGHPGGPRWDVVHDHDSAEIQTHLKTMSVFDLDHRLPLEQTIIRIPLRTAAQAAKSKIFQQKVDIDTIVQALHDFGREMSDGGLLFLKNIRKIVIRLDNDELHRAELAQEKVDDAKTREQLSTDFHVLYASQPSQTSENIFQNFELNIKYTTSGRKPQNSSYAVQHAMLRSLGDEELDVWARERKLFPWVAVAAPLIHESEGEAFRGRLFTILRLPMPTNLPVHVHGLFCIAPDRGRLDFTRGSSELATRWNTAMFTRCVTVAWTKLLASRKNISWRREMFDFWPKPNFTPIESITLWDQMDDSVIDRVIDCKLEVWNATNGRCVDMDSGFFASKDGDAARYEAIMNQYSVPAVFLEDSLFRKVQHRASKFKKDFRILLPTSVRRFLRWRQLPQVSEQVASSMLEFCLFDAMQSQLEEGFRSELYDDLEGIELWPTVGDTQSLSKSNVDLLLPRDDLEMELFAASRASTTISLTKLSPLVRKTLLKDIKDLTVVMRFRGLGDLATDWPIMYNLAQIAGPLPGTVQRPSDLDATLAKIWAWIPERIREGQRMVPALLGKLWLIPLSNGCIQRYAASPVSIPVLTLQPQDQLYDFLTAAASRSAAVAPPIVDVNLLPEEAVGLLRSNDEIRRTAKCTSINEPRSFVDWLVAGKSMLLDASDQDRERLLSHLETITRHTKLVGDVADPLIKQMRRLPLYRKVTCQPPFRERGYTRCSLDAAEHLYETPLDLPPLPLIPGASFFEPDSVLAVEGLLVKRLKALETASVKSLLTRHFLPWMRDIPTAIDDPLCTAKEGLVNWVMKVCPHGANSWRTEVFSQAIIPLTIQDEQRHYRRIEGMVSPDSKLADVYDPEELLFPCRDFFNTHKAVLLSYGIMSELSTITPLERARYFAQRRGNINTHETKVQKLLKLSYPLDLLKSKAVVEEIQRLEWLPGTCIDGESTLLAPNKCRGADESHLINLVWATTTLGVSANWRKLLGWNDRIQTEVLLQQLDCCLLINDAEKVDNVLLRISPDDCLRLTSRECIPGRSGKRFTPDKVFLTGSSLARRPLAPYLDEVDGNFARKHQRLLEALKIQQEPSIQDLQNVQDALMDAFGDKLTAAGVDTAIACLEIAARRGYDCTDLLVPDTESRLRGLEDIVYGDRLRTGDTLMNFTHPQISAALTRRLGIEDSLEAAIRLHIDVDSDDDEDYTPKESLKTKISDTLERYPVATTFNEFLANADDAKARKVIWTLDECIDGPHASSILLTRDLKSYQGPALMVYNDGSFTKKDFSGFKNLGQGGKQDEITSTGMFGLGALTMYHFTDVPMLVSADSFLVLDPQQQVLPVDYRRRRERRVGTKMPISTMNSVAVDQLSPFDGLHEFDRCAEVYDGTIFRFPLRSIGSQTSLRDTSQQLSLAEVKSLLMAYFATARTALLFLQNVECIEFHIRGQPEPQWTVTVKRTQGAESHFKQMKITSSQIGATSEVDTWCIGLKNVKTIPPGITRSGRSARKSVECGVAARQGTKSSLEGQAVASLLDKKTCISALYLETLQYLAPRLGQRAFEFWPITGKPNDLSGILGNAFWYCLAIQGSDYPNLLPLPAQDAQLDGKLDANLLHQTQKATSFTAAVFDFLPKLTSEGLRSLIFQTVPFVVRPPDKLWDDLQKIRLTPPMKTIDTDYLRHIFKNVKNCELLEAFVTSFEDEKDKCRVMALLLESLIPQLDDAPMALNTLDGCRIIPRPQFIRPFGTLVMDPQPNTVWNLLPTSQEQKLFSFAAGTMVNNEIFAKLSVKTAQGKAVIYNPIEVLLKAGSNVRRLEIGDLGSLLAHAKSPLTSGHTDDLASWMPDFWQYLNDKFRRLPSHEHNPETSSKVSGRALLSKANLHDRAIYRSFSNSQWHYISPQQFESLPCVVTPLNHQHQQLCSQIQGLIAVDRDCIPYTLRANEDSFTNAASFQRLLRALEKLELATRTSAKTFVGHYLDKSSQDVMRTLTLEYLKSGVSQSNESLNAVLRRLPIWPRAKPSDIQPHEHIAAEDATFCGHKPMLMPWVSNLSAFVDPQMVESRRHSFRKLGIEPMTVEQAWHCIKNDIPNDIKPMASKSVYLKFIEFLATNGVKPLGKFAPNGNSILCETGTLYDHKDEMFEAAFREEKAVRFLHKDMQASNLRSFWLSIGLRARPSTNVMSHEHFLECAHAINRRWDPVRTSAQFSEDAQVVAQYLSYDRPEFRAWPNNVWTQVTTIPLFAVRIVQSDEVWYRQNRMRQLAHEKTHCSIRDTCDLAHKRIMWSQSRFLKNPPGNFVYKTLPQGGTPAAAQVFSHLGFLITIIPNVSQADMPEYLRDVQACYDYLQANLDATKSISGIRKARVWLNLETTQVDLVFQDSLQSSLTSAEFLCLKSPVDPAPLKVANHFLVPYEKLLVGLGCQTVVQPKSTALPLRADSKEQSLALAMTQMRTLRDQGLLIDVTLEAQGERKPAHKIVLAAVSEHCRANFAGPWGDQLKHQAIIPLEDLTYLSLSQMVDFAYTGDINWPVLQDSKNSEEVEARLIELLNLLDATDMWLLTRLHEMTETFLISQPHSAIYVRVDTVFQIRERAESARALRLVRYCEDFLAISSNRNLAERLREDS